MKYHSWDVRVLDVYMVYMNEMSRKDYKHSLKNA
jgi:hypothetical protein